MYVSILQKLLCVKVVNLFMYTVKTNTQHYYVSSYRVLLMFCISLNLKSVSIITAQNNSQ